jgi:predicted nucleic acid-binding protein
VIVLDTTILVYAHGRGHPLREPCRSILAAAAELREVRTTVEVIQEFAHHRARTRDRADAVRLARQLAEGLGPLVAVTPADLEDGLRLFEEVAELGAFDAVLAAAARNSGADALVSADRGFAAVPGLQYVDPAEPGALERLSQV